MNSVEKTISLIENNPQLSRRDFLKLLATLGIDFLLPIEKLTPAELLKLPPNPNLPAVGFSIVPREIAPHYPGEPVIMTMNFGDLEIGGYGEGFRKAKGQRTLKIEQYPKDKPLSLLEWENYIKTVISRYSGVERVIVGNECNVPKNQGSYMSPEEYASCYGTAWRAIRSFSPETRVSLYGEAYYGNHTHLRNVLQLLKNKGIRPDEGSVHFYDYPQKLGYWLVGYQNVLNEFFGDVPIHISEIGKPISISINDEQHASLLVQDLALSAAYIEQGKITLAAWFAAATFNKDQSFSIFRFSKTVNGKLEPSCLVIPWLLVTRALHHQVKPIETRGLIMISGLTADNHQALVLWSKTGQSISFNPPRNMLPYNLYGQEIRPMCSTNPIFLL